MAAYITHFLDISFAHPSLPFLHFFVFISPSFSYLVRHEISSATYNVWLDFIKTRIRLQVRNYHYNIPYSKVSLTCNVWKHKRILRGKNYYNFSLGKHDFYTKLLSYPYTSKMLLAAIKSWLAFSKTILGIERHLA